MKLLMLGWELPPHNSGGLGVACFQMAKALADQGADIDFVIPYKAEHPNADKFMNVISASTRPSIRQGFCRRHPSICRPSREYGSS